MSLFWLSLQLFWTLSSEALVGVSLSAFHILCFHVVNPVCWDGHIEIMLYQYPIHRGPTDLGFRKFCVLDFSCPSVLRCFYCMCANKLRWAGHLVPGWGTLIHWLTYSHIDRQTEIYSGGRLQLQTDRNTDRSLWVQTCWNPIHRGWKWANQGQCLPAEFPQ